MSDTDDLLRAGLKALVPYLKQFTRKHLEKKYGPKFREHLSRPGERPFSETDPRSLIKVSLSEAVLHQAELQENWKQMKAGQPLNGIAPLD